MAGRTGCPVRAARVSPKLEAASQTANPMFPINVSPDGTQLATHGPDGFFGEMALLDNHRRSATVTALEDTECMAIMRSDFLAEVRNNPDLAIEILAVMSKRIRDLDEKLAHS